MALSLGALSLAACECGGPRPGEHRGSCRPDEPRCNAGLICIGVDGICETDPHGGDAGDAGSADGGVSDTGVNDTGMNMPDTGPPCTEEELCGGICCGSNQECIDNTCEPLCPTARCGEEQICCGSPQTCVNNACMTPGDACIEDIDCPEEQYCERSIGACLPRSDSRCEYRPPITGDFTPIEEWHWDGSETLIEPDYKHVMMTPVVGDLLDNDGIPEVVFTSYSRFGGNAARGVIRIVRGDDGTEITSIASPQVCGNAGLAIGDLDGDGAAEIVAAGFPCRPGGPIYAFNADGTLKWTSLRSIGGAVFNYQMDFGAPTIADLEGDGLSEVIVGGTVINHDGVVRFSNRDSAFNCCGTTSQSAITVVYDVDGDNELEIVGSNIVWNADGTVLWEDSSLEEGFIAVADFFSDGVPDIVVVHTGNVSIRRGYDGALLWGPFRIAVADGEVARGAGGPPTVADFDNDGLPEIGVAGYSAYAVYDPDGPSPILWAYDTDESSSSITGSSVFDFEGDGQAEVVYNDECYMRVFDGATGAILYETSQHSHTLTEYPVIVDVDADGNAEIVMAANAQPDVITNQTSCADDYPGYDGYRDGVRVYRDGRDNWVGTRTVWNQHAYSITNIRQDLSVPTEVLPNFQRFNNFRQNSQSFDAPDLTGISARPGAAMCSREAGQELIAVVQNIGAVTVEPGLPVAFFAGSVDTTVIPLGTGFSTEPILPGGTTEVHFSYLPPGPQQNVDQPWFFIVDYYQNEPPYADGSGAHNECVENNNMGPSSTFFCQIVD